jgi:hypothetical protein
LPGDEKTTADRGTGVGAAAAARRASPLPEEGVGNPPIHPLEFTMSQQQGNESQRNNEASQQGQGSQRESQRGQQSQQENQRGQQGGQREEGNRNEGSNREASREQGSNRQEGGRQQR